MTVQEFIHKVRQIALAQNEANLNLRCVAIDFEPAPKGGINLTPRFKTLDDE